MLEAIRNVFDYIKLFLMERHIEEGSETVIISGGIFEFILMLLHFVTIAAFIVLCAKLVKINDKKKLQGLKIAVIVYLALTFALSFNDSIVLPPFLTGWFFSADWLFWAKYLFSGVHPKPTFLSYLLLYALYWTACGFLIADIQNRINEQKSDNRANPAPIAPSFTIAIAALILIIVKDVCSIPALTLSVIGIASGAKMQNKNKKLNRGGFVINIVCLAICALGLLLA